MDVILPVFGLAFLGSVAGLAGGVLLLFNKQWGKFLSVHAVSFAAGVLLAVALLDILPEALNNLEPSVVMMAVLAVIVAASLLEQLFAHFHHHDEHDSLTTAIPLVLVGDTIHNFLDGVAIAAAFLVEPRLGVFVALATFLHELPQEIGDFAILLASGWKRVKIILFNLLTACSTFVGAFLTLHFAPQLGNMTSVLLAIAGGLFLYIATADLLPKIGLRAQDRRWHQYVLFLIGIGVMMTFMKLVRQ